MVNTSVIIGLILIILICFGIPIGGCIYLSRKRYKILKPFLIGMLVFFVSQILVRIPILQVVLPQFNWFLLLPTNPWAYGLFMGGTAALAEELGRYVGMRFFMKKNHRFVDGVAFGLGHGGIEAMLIVGLVNIINLAVLLTGNSPELAAAITPFAIFMAGFERICTLIVQVGLSVLVLYTVRSRNGIGLIAALVIHTLLDALIVIIPGVFGGGVIFIEAALAVLAIAFLIWMIKKARQLFDSNVVIEESL